MLTAPDIYRVLEARRRELDLSQAEVGLRAFGTLDNSSLQSIRRGHAPSPEKLEALAQALDLELYLGPRRDDPRLGSLQLLRLAAKEVAEKAVERLRLDREPWDFDWDTAIDQAVGHAMKQQEIAPVFEIDGTAFAALPIYGVEVSAGPGTVAGDEAIVERVAFRRDWLQDHGVALDRGCLLKVRGDSMAPRLSNGDLVLVDRARDEVRDGGIYAFVDADGTAKVKRLNRGDRGTLILSSDNPDYPLELRRSPDLAAVRIIGEMVWSGHTWR